MPWPAQKLSSDIIVGCPDCNLLVMLVQSVKKWIIDISMHFQGRGGKGNIYVWATGNGGLTDDDCNCDGYTTSIYTISVGCIGDHGLSAYYTELCSSTLGVTFNGGSHREKEENKMVSVSVHKQICSCGTPGILSYQIAKLEDNNSLNWEYGEVTRAYLPTMWSSFESWNRRHNGVEFLLRGVFSRFSGFQSPTKRQHF